MPHLRAEADEGGDSDGAGEMGRGQRRDRSRIEPAREPDGGAPDAAEPTRDGLAQALGEGLDVLLPARRLAAGREVGTVEDAPPYPFALDQEHLAGQERADVAKEGLVAGELLAAVELGEPERVELPETPGRPSRAASSEATAKCSASRT